MITTPKRCWFRPRYSLTTLFVVVTAVACWLGYELNWIRQRREFLSQNQWGVSADSGPESIRAPAFLWLLGESGINRVVVTNGNDKTRDEAIRLSPEAGVITFVLTSTIGSVDDEPAGSE